MLPVVTIKRRAGVDPQQVTVAEVAVPGDDDAVVGVLEAASCGWREAVRRCGGRYARQIRAGGPSWPAAAFRPGTSRSAEGHDPPHPGS